MKERELEKILKALANRRRLSIVKYLRNKKEANVGDIAEEIKLSFKATSKHLMVLYSAGIVEKSQRSLQMFYCLDPNLHAVVKHISNSLE
jgi:DNA-binding transcriptional ArsR family regulator